MLGVALWPFNPLARNRVSWLRDQDGIRFADSGIVFSSKGFQGSLMVRSLNQASLAEHRSSPATAAIAARLLQIIRLKLPRRTLPFWT